MCTWRVDSINPGWVTLYLGQTHWRRLVQNIGGHKVWTIGDNWWHHRRFWCYVIRHRCKLVHFLYSAVHSLSRAALKFVMLCCISSTSGLKAFSATWFVLILVLKINILREMTIMTSNFTLVSTTTWTSAEPYTLLHNYLWPAANWNRLNSLHEWWEKFKVAASSSTVCRQCLQLGLRSCKALMKRLMSDVQRRYTSWNCKMWEKMIVSDESCFLPVCN